MNDGSYDDGVINLVHVPIVFQYLFQIPRFGKVWLLLKRFQA